MNPAAATIGRDTQLADTAARERNPDAWPSVLSTGDAFGFIRMIEWPREWEVSGIEDDGQVKRLTLVLPNEEDWQAELATLRERADSERLSTKAAHEYAVLRIVREAKLLRAEGKTRSQIAYAIARDLRRDDIPTARGATLEHDEPQFGAHAGEPSWRPQTVQRVLNSKAAKRLGWSGS